MAAKDQEREYDFVEQPQEEFFCPVTLAVLLEPYQTQCCANHLSQEAYQRLQGQPCPVCREENLAAVKDNFHKRKVLSLKVRCPHKAEVRMAGRAEKPGAACSAKLWTESDPV